MVLIFACKERRSSMGSRGAFVNVNNNNFSFTAGGQHYKTIGELSSNHNVKIIMQNYSSVRAPQYSHTANRIYAIVQNGMLKHVAYYDKNHMQSILVDLGHKHKGVKPHRHFYMNHDKNLPGVPATMDDLILIDKIRKEFHLK